MTDKNLLKMVAEFRKGILGGREPHRMCLAVTAPLHAYLNICGLDVRLVEGEVEFPDELWGHFWLSLPDGRIIDPTASQFNKPGREKMPDVYLGRPPMYYREGPLNSVPNPERSVATED